MGYSFCPDHTQTDHELLAFADTAMFHAKEHRLGYVCYQTEMTNRLVEYRKMQEHLSHGLERNEFFLLYQPQVDVQTEEVIGVEALLRWRHDGEVVPPQRSFNSSKKAGRSFRWASGSSRSLQAARRVDQRRL